jgi:multidrug resistance efflux pump
MNHRPSTDTNSAEPELNVSIAGSSHDTMAAALDEAVAQLNRVTSGETPPPGHTPHAIDASAVISLLQGICTSMTRREAVVELVTFLDARSADCTVRGGLGQDQLNRIYDPRLGWLGPESSLYDQLRDRWQIPSDDEQESSSTQVLQSADYTTVMMSQPEGNWHCFVWIHGSNDQREKLAWLPQASAAISSAIWSRPAMAWPGKVAQQFHRSSISVAFVVALVLIAAFWPVHYRIACQARVETTAQRLIATPFDATLQSSNFKPGDMVTAGAVLMVLDGRPLRLEREAIQAEQQQVAKEHDSALATGRIAESQQATLKKRQLARRYELLSDRLQNLEVVSPIDGVVVSGDLDRYVGSPLERGQTVMEIAPLSQMVIEIEIPEHEIGYVREGAETRIKIDAIGGKSLRHPIENIFPRAELREDQNVFIAKIEVENIDQTLKPGMRGEATTYGPIRPWFWSWLRGGFEKVLWWIGY